MRSHRKANGSKYKRKASTTVAKKRTSKANGANVGSNTQEKTITQAFWGGFLWPIKALWRAVCWVSHKPPLKQLGHALRWFFHLKVMRFIGRVLGLRYLRDSWKELRQVTWPTFRESRRLTLAVIMFSIVFGLLIAVVDYGLDKAFKYMLKYF